MHRSAQRRKFLLMLLVLLTLAGAVGHVEASEGLRGDRCEVDAETTVADDLYFLCRVLEVRGTVEGDLVGVASSVTIYEGATVTGDVWVGGGKLTVAGTVGDDVHFGGVSLVIEPSARFTSDRLDVVALSLDAQLLAGAVLPGNLLVYGYQAQVAGTVGGDVDFVGEALTLQGVVTGQVDANVGDPRRNTDLPSLPFYDVTFIDPGLYVDPQARILGDLHYSAATPSEVPRSAVKGRLRFEQTGGQPDITKVAQPNDAAKILREYVVSAVRDVLTLLALGAVGLRIAPGMIRRPAQHVRRRTVPTIGWGLLTFMLAIPTVITVLMLGLIVTLVLYLVKLNELTVMVGVGVLITTSALVGILSFLLLFMGRLVVSYTIGQMLSRRLLRMRDLSTYQRWLLTLSLGAVAYALAIHVPVPALALVLELVTALAGVGAVIMHTRRLLINSGLFTPAALAEPLPALPAPPPPPPPEEVPLGMEDLPEGFRGFDEDW